MKFISKATNFCAVLRPGIEGNRLTGQPAQPGKYMRFENGCMIVNDEKDIEDMKLHPGFNRDFIAVEENDADPWGAGRREKEPAHNITEMKYGTPGKAYGTPVKPQITPELRKVIEEAAKAMAVPMAKEILKDVLAAAKSKQETEATTSETEPEIAPPVIPEVKPEVKEEAPKVKNEKPAAKA